MSRQYPLKNRNRFLYLSELHQAGAILLQSSWLRIEQRTALRKVLHRRRTIVALVCEDGQHGMTRQVIGS